MRVCVPRFDQAYQFDEGSSRVSGPAAPIGNLFLEVTEGLNVSLLQKDTIAHLIEGSSDLYDGCLGSLQANESDTMVFGLNSYPCLGPNLRNGVVILAERLGLASAYPQTNITTDYKNTHVMDTLAPGCSLLPGIRAADAAGCAAALAAKETGTANLPDKSRRFRDASADRMPPAPALECPE